MGSSTEERKQLLSWPESPEYSVLLRRNLDKVFLWTGWWTGSVGKHCLGTFLEQHPNSKRRIMRYSWVLILKRNEIIQRIILKAEGTEHWLSACSLPGRRARPPCTASNSLSLLTDEELYLIKNLPWPLQYTYLHLKTCTDFNAIF